MNEHKSFFDKFNFSKSEKKNEEETNTEERTKYEERVKDIYHRIENKNCINCNKFSGHTDDGENGFCGEECRNSFLKNGDPLNEAYLKAALLDLDSSVEKQGKNHAFMMQKLATCLEKEMCPNCDKDWNTSETDRGDGFCSDTCRDEFMKKDPHNERYLKEA